MKNIPVCGVNITLMKHIAVYGVMIRVGTKVWRSIEAETVAYYSGKRIATFGFGPGDPGSITHLCFPLLDADLIFK